MIGKTMCGCSRTIALTASLLLTVSVVTEGWVSLSSSSPSSSFSRRRILNNLQQRGGNNSIVLRSSSSSASGDGSRDSESITNTNNNVVLRPSSDSKEFDTLKIGSAKVHRYRKEDDPEGNIEYVMWYHGRSKEFDPKNELPPLSTGRIGRATSKNGLHWVKERVGSASEDMEGVSLGLNNESWWNFDTSHVGLGSVMLPMSTPAVLTEGGVYLMYYFGGNYDETPLGDYTDTVPDAMKDSKVVGMNTKIGVAVSMDGNSWGRVEGDDPSGACVVPYDRNDPNLEPTAATKSNDIVVEEELYCGWPEVVAHIAGENSGNGVNLLNLNSKKPAERSGFSMYYTTMTRNTKEKCIASAVSTEGFRWLKAGVCLRPTTDNDDSPDAGGCARCTVSRDAKFDNDKGSWVETNIWNMYYEGISKKDNKHRICLATSKDGTKWDKKGLALDVGQDDLSWDVKGVGAPHIILMDDGTKRMYYTGQSEDDSTAIGVATLVADGGGEWKREQTAVTFA